MFKSNYFKYVFTNFKSNLQPGNVVVKFVKNLASQQIYGKGSKEHEDPAPLQ